MLNMIDLRLGMYQVMKNSMSKNIFLGSPYKSILSKNTFYKSILLLQRMIFLK